LGRKHKHLIEQIADWDNLIAAHRLARRGKRDRSEVIRYEARLWEELAALQMELLHGTYQPGRYREFTIYEPKRRLIMALPYRDRVAQHAIAAVCAPIWDRAMIDDAFACRPGKGTHYGADRVERWMREMDRSGHRFWVLKMDLSQFFPSIPHDLAKRVVRRKISCGPTLALLDRIIDSTAGPDEAAPVGIPVGNLTSQWVANLVGNEIDQWAKREMGLKRYGRYMDDMVVLTWSKEEALRIRAAFADKLAELGFVFSKTTVQPASRGVNLLGYRIWPHKRLLRKQSVVRMSRRLKRLQKLYGEGRVSLHEITQRVRSWIAHADHADSEGVKRRLLQGARFSAGGARDR